jgi:UTP--glucose-1-phosphate uridylyltransferase
LTNALKALLATRRHRLYALEFDGRWHDAGTVLGFLKTTVEFALERPDVAPGFREYLRGLRLDGGRPGARSRLTIRPPIRSDSAKEPA